MVYYVTKASPRYHQMTLEELWSAEDVPCGLITDNHTNTVTHRADEVPEELRRTVSTKAMINALAVFDDEYGHLYEVDRHSLYHSFRILKKSGGYRQIDAPLPELMTALRVLKDILEKHFRANHLYHTSAFAYIRQRNCVDAVKRHQQNESWWFAKLDFKNFFGSTTKAFVLRMLWQIFPFSQVVCDPKGAELLEKAIDLAFLDGVLPQGTPISPMLTNIMMIPIDYELSNGFRSLNKQTFVYTRYADDMLISSRYDFNVKDVEKFVADMVNQFDAPFRLNTEKTRYGSRSGSNWNLGVVLNKDNKISIGYKNLRTFKNTLHNFLRDHNAGIAWDIGDIQHALGLYSYYVMVDPETMASTVEAYTQKTGVDIIKLMKKCLNA